uniref:Phosducin n=1 Tax=Sphenodon punctatus TaxID=8508 RepID=A0A8D0G9B1_SPHPU
MEEHTSTSLEDEFDGHVTHTGPKGVINDWRKFKLESEDRDSLPLSKKEILRQMSSPHRSHSKEDKDTRERFSRKMSMHFGPKYGFLSELQNGEQFLETVEKERKTTTVIVHIYEDGIKGCEALNNSLTCLAAEHSTVKFCKIKASNTGAGDRFSTDVLPTLLVYKGGELLSNFISVTERFSEEFFAVDVEAFLNEYGLLPEKELPVLGNGNLGERDVE